MHEFQSLMYFYILGRINYRVIMIVRSLVVVNSVHGHYAAAFVQYYCPLRIAKHLLNVLQRLNYNVI